MNLEYLSTEKEIKVNREKRRTVIKLLLAVVLAVFVILKIDFAYLKSMGERLSLLWAFLSLLLVILMTVLKALQYQVLIDRGLRYIDVLRTVIWQNSISNFVTNSAGVASYMTMLKTEKNINLRRSGVVFLITKLGDLLIIGFYLGVASVFTWQSILPLRVLTVFLIFAILMGGIVFFITVLWRGRFVDGVEYVITWLRLDRFGMVRKGLGILHSLASEEQKAIFSMLRTSVALSLVYMTVTLVYSWANIKIFDVKLGIWPVVYVAAMRQLISYVPLQVLGGLGVTEVTSVYLYSIFGLDQGKMSAVMLGLRVLFYIRHAIIFLYIPLDTFLQKSKDV